jgi:hypothetical protein
MSVYVSLVVSIVGLLIYGFAANPKLAEVGRLAYAVGLLVFLWLVVGTKILSTLR